MNAKKIFRLALPLLFIMLLFSACSISREQVTKKPEPPKELPAEVSAAKELESTRLLVEATRQKILGNWSQATVLYDDALQKNPRNDAAYYELSKIHAMQGEFDEALELALMAARLDPDNPHYQILLADVYILKDQLPKSIEIYEELAGRYPQNPEYLYNLASAYLYNDQQQEALDALARIEAIVGFTEEISIQKQKIWVDLGQHEKAIEEARKLVALFPDELVYYELLGDLYRETGQHEKARDVYLRMLEREPDDPMANLLMADYYHEEGKPDRSFEYLEAAFRSPRMDAEGKARIMYTYYAISEGDPERLEQALKLCRLLVEIHPEDPESYLIYGDFLQRENEMEKARDMYLKGAKLDPSELTVWKQILSLDGWLQDFEAMLGHSEMALEYFFEQPILFFFNGIAHFQLKNYEEAASALEYGLVMAEYDPDLKEDFLSTLGDVYHYLDEFERSNEFYEKALALNPENATTLNNYSYHLSVRRERLDEAEQMSEKSLELQPGNAAFQDTYGWIMYQKGRYEEAEYWIGKAIEGEDEPSGVVFEHYGDVLYKLGEHDEAIRYWKKAESRGDGSDLLEKKIKDRTLYE